MVSPFASVRLVSVLITAASGLVGAVLTVYLLHQLRAGTSYTALARPYAAFSGLFTLGAFGYAGVRLTTAVSADVIVLLPFLLVVPWSVFVLRYIGRGRQITRLRLVAGSVAIVGLIGWLSLVSFGGVVPSGDAGQAITAVTGLSLLVFLVVVSSLLTLVLAATYRHERLSVAHGAVVVLPIVEPIFAVQLSGSVPQPGIDLLVGATFTLAAVTLVASVGRYRVTRRRPGAKRRGERAALTDTDGAVFVLDTAGRIIRANQSAVERFGDGGTLEGAVGRSVAELLDSDTVTCWTQTDRRRFDPRVSTLTDGHGETVGYTVTLIDVTDREIRRQRLQVMNRILRHNVRNELDVIKAHGEDAELQPVLDSADRLASLSERVRRIEQLVERSRHTERSTPLASVASAVTAEFDTPIETAVPEVTLAVDEELCRYALVNLVENAIEHNDSPEPWVQLRATQHEDTVQIVVADDGPGIPDAERAVINAGTENPLAHASSVGLWSIDWAVRTMGGSLSFGWSDAGGTAVTIELPRDLSDE